MGIFRVHILIVSVLYLTGCIALAPTPEYARTGDMIQVNLGGIKRNANMQPLSIKDLVATITDANGSTYNLKLGSTYPAFPSHMSQYALRSLTPDAPGFTELDIYDGAWWVSVLLTDEALEPLPLATGPATISISSSKLIQTGFVQFPGLFEGVYNQLPIEILPGQNPSPPNPGSTSSNPANQYSAFEDANWLTVRPDLAPDNIVGGAQIVITYDASLISNGPYYEFQLLPITHNPHVSIIQNTFDNGDGTKTLKAYITNPKGFVTNRAEFELGNSFINDLSFGLVSLDFQFLQSWDGFNISVESDESYYIDLSGNEIPDIEPLIIDENTYVCIGNFCQ